MAEVIPLDAKLGVFDENAKPAVRWLIDWLREDGDDLVALARGRHVWGHYRFGDRNFQEYDTDELLANAAEELADAIVYIAKRLSMEESCRSCSGSCPGCS